MNAIILETKRLILKLPSQSDFEELLTLRTDPEVMRYMPSGIQTKEQIPESLCWLCCSVEGQQDFITTAGGKLE